MSETLSTLSQVFTLAFVVTSMFSMGLRLTVQQIIEPLRNVRLVVMALLANFVIVPAAAFVLAQVFGLAQDLRIGLLLLSTAAGAPMLPKLAQIAHGNIPFAVGLVALLLVVTVIYLPLVLPLLLPGVQVDALAIAGPLALQMLAPLALGLLVNSLWDEEAEALLPVMGEIANTSLTLMLVLQLGLNIGNLFGLLGTGAILAIGLLIAAALAGGYLLGGPDPGTRRVLALGTGQRNLAAAFAVATGNFIDRPDVLVLVAAAGLAGMLIVMPLAGQWGRRTARAEAVTGSQAIGAAAAGKE